MHGVIFIGLRQAEELVGLVDFLLERLPIGNGLLDCVEFLCDALGFLIIGPEIGRMGFFFEIIRFAAEPFYLKDTPVAFPGEFSVHLCRQAFP